MQRYVAVQNHYHDEDSETGSTTIKWELVREDVDAEEAQRTIDYLCDTPATPIGLVIHAPERIVAERIVSVLNCHLQR